MAGGGHPAPKASSSGSFKKTVNRLMLIPILALLIYVLHIFGVFDSSEDRYLGKDEKRYLRPVPVSMCARVVNPTPDYTPIALPAYVSDADWDIAPVIEVLDGCGMVLQETRDVFLEQCFDLDSREWLNYSPKNCKNGSKARYLAKGKEREIHYKFVPIGRR